MTVTPAMRIVTCAGLLAAALVAFVAREGYARATGHEAVLALRGVDPRDLLTGHSVLLSFQNQRKVCPANPTKLSWLALQLVGDHDEVVASAQTRVALGSHLVMRGRANCLSLGPTIDIGIERFHADQRTTEAISAKLATGRLSDTSGVLAVVSIGGDGRARLKRLLVGSRRYDLNWL